MCGYMLLILEFLLTASQTVVSVKAINETQHVFIGILTVNKEI